MGEYKMKLTASRLRSLIKQVVKENKMNLVDGVTAGSEDEVMNAVRGEHPTIDIKSLGIMSGEKPDGIQSSQEENDRRNQALIEHINKAGAIAYMVGGMFFKNQERSVLILNPHELASKTAGDFAKLKEMPNKLWTTLTTSSVNGVLLLELQTRMHQVLNLSMK